MKKTKRAKQANRVEKILAKHWKIKNGLSLFALINEYFWRSWSGPFFAFIFPLIFISLLGYLLSYNIILGGALGLGSIVISVYCLPNSIYDFKRSSLLKRIGVTPISPIGFVITICGYYSIMMIVSLTWCTIMSLLIFCPYWDHGQTVNFIISIFPVKFEMPSLQVLFNHVDWLGFIYSQLMIIFSGATLGMLVISICRSPLAIQSITVFVLIIAMVLGGQVVPMYIIKSQPALWYLGYVVDPFKSSVDMAIEAWNGPFTSEAQQEIFGKDIQNMMNTQGSTIFNINVDYCMYSTMFLPNVEMGKIVIMDKTEKILNFIFPFVWMGICTLISVKKFRWSTR